MAIRRQCAFQRINVLLLVCAAVCLVCYDIFGGLWLKGTTSAWFVLLGFVNLAYAFARKAGNARYLLFTQLGLILGMCADVLLGIEFMLGIVSFALGHICYLIAFYMLEKPRWKDFAAILPIAAVSLYAVAGMPFIRIEDALLKKLLLGYAVIIACMLGKAITNWGAKKNASRGLVLLGSAMFWFSDLMLAIDLFGQSSRITWILCSYTYWPAQNILAHAMFHYVNESERSEA